MNSEVKDQPDFPASTEEQGTRKNTTRGIFDPVTAGGLLAVLVTLVLALVPTLMPIYPAGVGRSVMQMFSFVCHQIPDRSPHLSGVQLAVCHRCMGIYWAMPLAAMIYLVRPGLRAFHGVKNLTVVIVAAVPAGIDWLGDILGIWTNTPLSRVITGAILGFVAGVLLADGVVDIWRQRQSGRV